ncbi:high affinity copper uptake protein 1-like [Orbicella faveolata]|uniref:high affinity copper uptake protein 1-like n=1 Tax=Orbicella faveolata TaxID=48498 RepID=UPI0009E40306|nr:high affinity copper uptake protein 1-like [Orbicella faveolata]
MSHGGHGGHMEMTTASTMLNNGTTPTMDHDQMGHDDMMGHGMMMYFHFSKSVTILFESWSVNDATELVFSCVAIFVLAALYEGLKVLREVLKRRYSYVVSVDLTETKVYGTGPNQTTVVTESKGELPRSRICNWHHLVQTFLHVVQVTISYFLMLIFMTYNVWLCLAVALGAGFGYFVFGWKLNKVVDIYEHCH